MTIISIYYISVVVVLFECELNHDKLNLTQAFYAMKIPSRFLNNLHLQDKSKSVKEK